MIFYKLCSESNLDDVYEAFKIGFSDYMIKLDMPKEMFIKRFLGPEGNDLSISYIAFDGSSPVGLILGGIKEYEGIKTMRCGALCIHPDYRGKGVSQNLLKLHKETAIDNNCRQLFLEVIVGNDRAFALYKKYGYEKIYDLCYYSCSNPLELLEKSNATHEIKQISFNEMSKIALQIQDIHINWQNDFDYIEKSEGQVHYGAYQNEELAAVLSGQPSGRINFIWVRPDCRLKGIARRLLCSYISEYNPQKLALSFPNNSKLAGFASYIGFKLDNIKVYEMYLTL
jgi:ribosomal protein S18 acetylase RimI-like enzyme